MKELSTKLTKSLIKSHHAINKTLPRSTMVAVQIMGFIAEQELHVNNLEQNLKRCDT